MTMMTLSRKNKVKVVTHPLVKITMLWNKKLRSNSRSRLKVRASSLSWKKTSFPIETLQAREKLKLKV